MMYKLMIIDDEADIREGLVEAMDFAALGFEVVGEAENGIEGLRLAEALAPDLIITDIRMPLMDGLTMAEKMRKFLPTVQILVLSGYDEFEYARQAIGISVLDYILKPVSKADLTEIMRITRQKMDREFQRQTDMIQLRAHFEASLPALRELLLNSLAAGGIDEAAALRDARRYGIDLSGGGYALALMRADQTSGSASISDPELMRVAVQNIAEAVFSRRQGAHMFHYSGMLAALLLLGGTGHEELLKAMDALEEIQKSADYYAGCRLVIGVSAPVARVDQLKRCAAQAATALSHAGAAGGAQIVSILDVSPGASRAVVVDDALLRSLADAVKMGDIEKAGEAISRLLQTPRYAPMTPPDYRAYLLEILMTFMHVERDLGIERPESGEADSFVQLMLCPPVDTARALLGGVARRIARAAAEKRTSSSRLLVDRATAYIEAHFSEEDISIETLCRHLHISTSYLSAIFRKELGKTFLQFLTERRMDTAMNLLITSERKTAEISSIVGISDPSYFSYAFKKHFGISPSQARKGRGDPHA